MFGIESIADTDLPTRPQTLALFASMGFLHTTLHNLLQNRPIYHRPLRSLYRIAVAVSVGFVVDHVAPWYKRRAVMRREFEERMQAWREGVLKRRQLEKEMCC